MRYRYGYIHCDKQNGAFYSGQSKDALYCTVGIVGHALPALLECERTRPIPHYVNQLNVYHGHKRGRARVFLFIPASIYNFTMQRVLESMGMIWV